MLVRPLGRLTPCLPLRVDFDVHASDALARLISAAAQRLNLEVACKSLVKVYLRGGALLDTVDHFEKDDEIYIASDGDAWREPSDAPVAAAASKDPGRGSRGPAQSATVTREGGRSVRGRCDVSDQSHVGG